MSQSPRDPHWHRDVVNARDFYWFRLMPPGGPQRLGAVAQVGT